MRVVDTEADFKAALQNEPQILLSRLIECNPGITVPYNTRIYGRNRSCGIKFRFMDTLETINGMEFNGAGTGLINCTLKNYNQAGAAVKGHGTGVLDVDVTFDNCGIFAKQPIGEDASKVFYNHCIASHSTHDTVNIVGCHFLDSAQSQWDYSHCIYVEASRLRIRDNDFARNGNPLALGDSVSGVDRIEIVGNIFRAPATTKDRMGALRPAYFASLPAKAELVFVDNAIAGKWSYPWTGHPNPNAHYINHNDYRLMTWLGHWAADTGKGIEISKEQWVSMGFDKESQWPLTTV